MESVDPSRGFLKDVRRIVIKVGTAVVTRDDGRLALGRLGALCEQNFNTGHETTRIHQVKFYGCGDVALSYRAMVQPNGMHPLHLPETDLACLSLSFADLQKPQPELDGKACAAVGQNGLMALYDTLFSQLDDSSGIFWDNDSLAALLALELKADLLVLLSDVDGLYSGPPSDPQSKLIYTYIKEKLENTITFGDKSRLGRGGMTAKVKAAVYASQAGIPVVITSGFAGDNIIKVLRGQRIGTLFHREAHTFIPNGELNAREMAVAARESSRLLQAMPAEERSKILLSIADALEANEKMILHENEADVSDAHDDGYESSLLSRLALKPGKVSTLAKAIRVLANMEEPIGQVLKRTEVRNSYSKTNILVVIYCY
nr:delta-1-pyrroline-5-carboxylate synthase-like [Tanacetum cinerariifolium]